MYYKYLGNSAEPDKSGARKKTAGADRHLLPYDRGRVQGIAECVKALMEAQGLDFTAAADTLKVPEEDRAVVAEKLDL